MKKLRNFEGAPHGNAFSFQPDCVFAWPHCAVSGSQIVWALVEQDALHDFWNKVHCMSLEDVPEAQRVEHEHGVFLQCVCVVFLDLLWFAGLQGLGSKHRRFCRSVVERHAFSGVQRHSDGWRARMRLGLGTAQGRVRLTFDLANEDWSPFKGAEERSVGAARALLSEMRQENSGNYRAVKTRLAVMEWLDRGTVEETLTGRSKRSIRVDETLTVAAKLLVKEHLSMEEFARGSAWLRDLGW